MMRTWRMKFWQLEYVLRPAVTGKHTFNFMVGNQIPESNNCLALLGSDSDFWFRYAIVGRQKHAFSTTFGARENLNSIRKW